MTIQQNVAEYIAERGIKHSAVAQAIGMDKSTFSRLMRGKRKLTAEEYGAICTFLEKPMDFFRNQ